MVNLRLLASALKTLSNSFIHLLYLLFAYSNELTNIQRLFDRAGEGEFESEFGDGGAAGGFVGFDELYEGVGGKVWAGFGSEILQEIKIIFGDVLGNSCFHTCFKPE